jgi:hypothetical protein
MAKVRVGSAVWPIRMIVTRVFPIILLLGSGPATAHAADCKAIQETASDLIRSVPRNLCSTM